VNQNTIDYKILLDSKIKEIHKDEFQAFIKKIYSQNLEEGAWKHQFIHSPYEDTPLFLAFDNDKIVGSALMIGQKLFIGEQEISYYIFTTSGVLKEYRDRGVYAELLKLQRHFAKQTNKHFILAFPNKLAYPVLKLFGGFKDLIKSELVKTTFDNIDFTKNKNSFLIDSRLFVWRFEHKNYNFTRLEDSVIVSKSFNDSIDILAVYEKSMFSPFNIKYTDLDESRSFNVIAGLIKDPEHAEKVINVNVTYYPISTDINPREINVNLLMSDVY